jgi:hypothetical protein
MFLLGVQSSNSLNESLAESKRSQLERVGKVGNVTRPSLDEQGLRSPHQKVWRIPKVRKNKRL